MSDGQPRIEKGEPKHNSSCRFHFEKAGTCSFYHDPGPDVTMESDCIPGLRKQRDDAKKSLVKEREKIKNQRATVEINASGCAALLARAEKAEGALEAAKHVISCYTDEITFLRSQGNDPVPYELALELGFPRGLKYLHPGQKSPTASDPYDALDESEGCGIGRGAMKGRRFLDESKSKPLATKVCTHVTEHGGTCKSCKDKSSDNNEVDPEWRFTETLDLDSQRSNPRALGALRSAEDFARVREFIKLAKTEMDRTHGSWTVVREHLDGILSILAAGRGVMSNWLDMKNERNENGELTDLALALDAIAEDPEGCDCGVDELGSCRLCLFETALKSQWTELTTLRAQLAAAQLESSELRTSQRWFQEECTRLRSELSEEG